MPFPLIIERIADGLLREKDTLDIERPLAVAFALVGPFKGEF